MYTVKDLNKVILASAISSFGASLTWTGLPVFVYNSTGNSDDFSTLFMTSTLAGALFTIIGGQLADRVNRKFVTMICSLISAISVFSLYFFIDSKGSQAYLIVAMISSLVAALQVSSLSAWHSDIMDSLPECNGVLIAKKNAIMMTAKLLGMGLGPILYTYLGKRALIIDSGTVLFEVGILLFVANYQKIKVSGKKLGRLLWDAKKVNLLFISTLSGLLSLPIINMGLKVLGDLHEASAEQISTFWLIGAIGSLCSNTIMSRGYFKNISSQKQMIIGSFLMGMSYLTMGMSSSAGLFIICFSMHTLGNPIFNNVIGRNIIQTVSSEERGRFLSLTYSFQDFSILGVLLLIKNDVLNPLVFFQAALLIVFIRGIFVFLFMKEEK